MKLTLGSSGGAEGLLVRPDLDSDAAGGAVAAVASDLCERDVSLFVLEDMERLSMSVTGKSAMKRGELLLAICL